NISSLTIGSGVTSIGESAFSGCKGLEEVVIPNSVTSVDNSAFSGCKNISSLTIGSGVTSIGEFAFSGCKGLTEVVIPNSVTSIDNSAFSGCENISSLTIGSGVTSIGKSAFSGCKGLTEVVIPNNVTSIGKSAFYGCENISSLTIGDGVTSIGETAFWGCNGLTEVVIPNNVTSIGNSAFSGCENISSLTIGSGVTSIGESAFRGCKGLEEVVIPNNVTSIGNSAFYGCENISSLTIGSGVTSIGESAFSGCKGLTEVVIPVSVTSIGQDAFWECKNIAHVYCYADPEKLSWSDGCFDDFSGGRRSRSTKCHVFPEYEQAYKDKFGDEVNVEFVGDLSHDIDLGLGGTLYGYSLSLEGDIGVKFYMDLTGVDLSLDPYMVFTVPNGSGTETQTVTLNQAEVITLGEKTYYAFKCKVSAKDASSIIKAQLFAGEEKSETYTYSVKSYAQYIIGHGEEDQYKKAAPLAKALLSYCTCAQKYFGTNPDKLDESCIDKDALDAVTSIPQTDTHFQLGGQIDGVTFEGATLSLKSETTLSLYFKSDEELVFSCSGKEVERCIVGEYKVARIRGIKATELGTGLTLTYYPKSEEDQSFAITGSITYGAMDYCRNVVSGDYDPNLKNVAKAMYLYYQAAKAYVE
ncbi:MAG: leucine-rich repeat domain-containing protein, partial [Clostridiales bacterium]|nr:leucine-rich repeat domain-containing protein [Clostridiales bacterium]